MSDARQAIVAAARSCVGARFRPQGRDRAAGLDCVGLVAVAYRAVLSGPVPSGYAQRGGSLDAVASQVAAAGLQPIDPATVMAGDLLLLSTGPGQWHFAVLTESGFIHADAGLRRVTEVPGAPRWPVAGAWCPEGGF